MKQTAQGSSSGVSAYQLPADAAARSVARRCIANPMPRCRRGSVYNQVTVAAISIAQGRPRDRDRISACNAHSPAAMPGGWQQGRRFSMLH
jgi:hypothetical protein